MAKPSGIKITYAINQLAEWFSEQTGNSHVVIEYQYDTEDGESWTIFHTEQAKLFKSFTDTKEWAEKEARKWKKEMESEVKRRKILFRRF